MASAAMQETTLSARRGALSSEDDDGRDDSKTKKPSRLTMDILAHLRRFSISAPCLAVALPLLLVFIIAVAVLSRSRPHAEILVTPLDSLPLVPLLPGNGLEGLAPNFGSLGVPLCRSKHGKMVEWTSKDLLKGLEEFVPVYETRPIKNNIYGMGFDHSFGLWFMARWLKPDLMIESGAFKGHSTWVLRQAMPETRIISLSPRHPEKYLRKGPAYVDANCTYFAGKDFVDFGSVDWVSVLKKHGVADPSRVLAFFDDHQNELKRVKQALKAGFRNLIFEDNYDTGTGDHYSLRQICDQTYITGGGHSCFKDSDEAKIRLKRKKFWKKAVDIDDLCGAGEAWWGVKGYMRDNFNHSNKQISDDEHVQNGRFIESVLDLYWELPPVAGPSLTHQTRYDPARSTDPIIEDGKFGLFQRLGLTRFETAVFNGYTQMVFLRVSVSTIS
ncbi:uncharacterized protein LOC120257879 [Dioscorea cayenensis subsp. rotundata]|uniref:Uncharacterized protein LOC120257879 n=1 Tax=Dioscorea cayennensis subsp. rotundata TaxID=55577 RepID=A0AB40B1R1_DIOCR|nr:uncharacterized protein LOC120257879 [Dioscorea cayenensis subsp. rotundata]